MRVISGNFKSRILKGHKLKNTRPTMDKIKESVFSMIQNDVKDSIFLDLFSGSGSIGIEALSNNAKICYFVDNDIEDLKTIQENIKDLDLIEKSVILKLDYKKALLYFFNNNIKFDIIYLDPPYNKNYVQNSIELIEEYNLLNNKLICEFENEIINTKYKLIKEKKYNTKNIHIYQEVK